MLTQEKHLETLCQMLKKIYKDCTSEELKDVSEKLVKILSENNYCFSDSTNESCSFWNASSSILIAYPDAVFENDIPCLKSFDKLIEKRFDKLATIIHILPFLKSTSDGGFAISSHSEIETRLGDWQDLEKLSNKQIIMADLILNHVSSSHQWVKDFIKSINPGSSFIFSPDSLLGWEKVIRPRNSSLFINLSTDRGIKPAWTTFGPDQVDLNWKNPYIIIEFLNLIIRYFKYGIRWFRLDAVAFIWKESNTNCLHRDEVHEIVKLLRYLLKSLSPQAVLITETNVPEKENLSYLVSGDEAHLAYNFTLPPLLLESILSNKADLLNSWLSKWPEFEPNCSYLNFTASHDGIGLRALEGIMDKERIHSLLVNCEKRGGLISHRKMPNGEDSPYELNISWWSAMADGGIDTTYLQFERFILTQLLKISLKGVPAFYLQALLASENDVKTFGKTGQRRDLNRERFELRSILNKINQYNSKQNRIIDLLQSAMGVRSKLNCFHPESYMKCLSSNRSDFVIILRGNNEDERVFAIHNMTPVKLSLSLADSLFQSRIRSQIIWKDCLTNEVIKDNKIEFSPYNVKWMKILR